MKRIYMAVALGVFAFSASAQRSIDLEMLHAVPSTIIIDSVNLSNTVVAWGIVLKQGSSFERKRVLGAGMLRCTFLGFRQ